MIYCNTKELQDLTGTALSVDILLAIIEEASREIDAYLAPYGLTPSGDVAKAACTKFAQAGIAQYLKPEAEVSAYRKAGYALLDQQIRAQPSLPSSNVVYVRRVRGR